MVTKGLMNGDDAGVMVALELWNGIKDRNEDFDVVFSAHVLRQIKLIQSEENHNESE